MPDLRVGDVLYGYCGGHFGRDSYTDKRVEVIGSDWVVVRSLTEEGVPDFAACDPEDLCQYRQKPEPDPPAWHER